MTFNSANSIWRNPRLLLCILTGFSSGLPLFILISLLSAWLRDSGVDLKAIGLLALVQFPYVWKFLWAPLCDRYGFGMGRRRTWMLISQLGLLVTIPLFGLLSPQEDMRWITLLAITLAFLSASQDIAIDAYRRELLRPEEMGLGNVVHVNAYKIAGLVPGSLSLILADHMAWSWVYGLTALFMLPGLLMTIFVKEPQGNYHAPSTLRQAVVEPFHEFIQRKGWMDALVVLAFIFSYKLGDSMATALATPFYLDLGYSKTEIGLIAKNAGLWSSVAGGILGGIWMLKLGENRSLWVFGLLQAIVILGFAWLADQPHEPWRLALVIGAESFGVGLGTAAFVSFTANATHPAYAATQFALFTSLAATPRTVVNALTGFLVEGGRIEWLPEPMIFEGLGWQNFFIVCFIAAIPGMVLLTRVAPWKRDPRPS
jgi:MFS transporter, PAT family, beta-lactamase induction signal transducer AmpG